MRNLWHRSLCMLLTAVMVLGMVPVNALAAEEIPVGTAVPMEVLDERSPVTSGTGYEVYKETDNSLTLEVRDGAILESVLIGLSGGSAAQYSKNGKGYENLSTSSYFGGDGDQPIPVATGDTIKLQYRDSSWRDGPTFKIKVYYEVTVSTNLEGQGGIRYGEITYPNTDTDTFRVYTAGTEVFAADVPGYRANPSGVTIDSSCEIDVSYDFVNAEPKTVTLKTVGGEWGSARLSVESGSEAAAGTQVTLTAEPKTSTDSAVAYYLAATEIFGATLSDNAFIVGSDHVAVTVTFAKRELALSGSKAIEINGYTGNMALRTEGLKKKLVEAAVGESANISDYTVCLWADLGDALGGEQYVSIEDSTVADRLSGWIQVPGTEKIKIVWNASGDGTIPAVSCEGIVVSVSESRKDPVITQTVTQLSTDIEITNKTVESWFTVKSADGQTISADDVTVTDVSLPADGSTENSKVTVRVADNEYSWGCSNTYDVIITNPDYKAAVNYTTPEGALMKVYSDAAMTAEVDSGASVAGGTYYVKVTPEAEGVYVAGLSGVTVTSESWNDTVYTAAISLESAATEGAAAYNLGAVTGVRSINVKSKIAEVSFNANTMGADTEEFLRRVFAAAVADSDSGGIVFDDCGVALKGDMIVTGQNNTFVITWKETERYPAVSVEVEVPVTESRTQVQIIGTAAVKTVKLETQPTLDSLKASVEGAVSGLSVPEGAAALTYTADVDDLQNVLNSIRQGDTIYVTVTVASDGSDLYTSNYMEVEVPVHGVVKDAGIAVAVNGSGTVSGLKNGSYAAGGHAVTCTPAEGWYVDTVTVNGAPVNADQSTWEFSFTHVFCNGSGWDGEKQDTNAFALGCVPEYNIEVTFAEMSALSGNMEISVGVSGYTGADLVPDYDIRVSGLKAKVLNGVFGAGNYNADDYTVAMYHADMNISEGDTAATNVESLSGCFVDIGETETFIVTRNASGKYPAVSMEVKGAIYDHRCAAGLVSRTLAALNYDSADEIEAYVKDAAATDDVNPHGLEVSVEKTSGEIPAAAGVPATLIYQVSFPGSDQYKPDSCTLTVPITERAVAVKLDDCTLSVGDALPAWTYTVIAGEVVAGDTLKLTITCDAKDTDTAGTYAITAVDKDPNYAITVVGGTLTVQQKQDKADDHEGYYPIVFEQDTTGTIVPGGTVEIDGTPYVLDGNCTAWVPNTDARLVTTYRYKSGDSHYQTYPTNMYVWFLTITDSDGNGEADKYSAERVKELDDFFKYEGTSIRVNFSSNGIRFFTSVPADACRQLMDGDLLSGYKLVQAGTLYTKWSGEGSCLTRGTGVSSDVYGGKASEAFRVFSEVGNRNWYTGVLTGLDGDADTLGMDILSRPFVTLERDGEQIILYGGTVRRSIYYVAVQNRDYWATGTAYDNFIESIIATVESAR